MDLQQAPTGTLYESVATRISHLIGHGTFGPGDRLPSVRKLSAELEVSITTVLEAYRVLESQGMIEARPQSGYYVRHRVPALPAEPDLSLCSGQPDHVGVEELVMRICGNTGDPGLVQLGAAIPNPDLLPTAKLNRALAAAGRRLSAKSNLYDFPPGCEALRIQVAQRSLASGCSLTPDELVITNGCLEAISLALRAICRPGDTVAIESPTYFGILQAIELLGLKVLEIPTHPRTGMSLSALRFAIEQNPIKACVVMSNFNNPLGSLMPDENKRELVELLAEQEIPLIEDDVYGDLCFGLERPKTAKSFDRKDLVLLCSSFSKDLAPGYRVGWIAPGRFRKQLMRLKAASNLACATLPPLAIADFLANGGYDHHLRRIRRVYSHQVAMMAQAVLKQFPEGTRVTHPEGGFVLWVELPERVDTLRLYEKALKAGITFAPGPIFSARQRYRNFLRLNCAYWSETVEKALVTLSQLMATMR